ncbi:MAG: BMC domain-containing protein [Planctomycetes bacterium]|nr:BMC domain-containing protein [Planctomycetota bacterium]
MAIPKSIGAIELSSIAIGYQIEDAMLKAGAVKILVARTICSGKYLIVLGGHVGDVNSAIRAGLAEAGEAIIDHVVIPNVHESVFAALGQSAMPDANPQAFGALESFSGASIIAAADAAAKAAGVNVYRIHVAMALGGKGLCLMTGTLPDCTAAVRAGAKEIESRGLLVNKVVIANPAAELLADYI